MTDNQTKINPESSTALEQRLLRYQDMIPCTTAFIDARTPGSDKKENFCLIGGGVAENPDQVVHIQIPHGFDVGAARQPAGCKNSHHSHDTEEVFLIHSGDWKFTWGPDGSEGEVTIGKGDIISIPTQMFRGFENVGDDGSFLFSVLGHTKSGTAGNVIWAPYVFSKAKAHGLVLMDDGRLIDTVAGETIPTDVDEYRPLDESELENFRKMDREEFLNCICTQQELASAAQGGHSQFDGISEYAVIGPANKNENIGAGKMSKPHGFHVRRLQLEPDSVIPTHSRNEEEVLIVHQGTLTIETSESTFTLKTGDLFTCPIGEVRSYSNTGSTLTDVMVVRSSDSPASAQFEN